MKGLLLFCWLVFSASVFGAAPISLELKGGSVIQGDLVSWDGQTASVKADFGMMTLKKDQLSERSLQKLALSTGDITALRARITELEATVESLKRDNVALRQQLQTAVSAGGGTTTNARLTDGQVGTPSTTRYQAPVTSGLSYSRSSTGKRHNSNCRFYGSGRPCGPSDGIACKLCGG